MVLVECLEKYVVTYLDNVLIYSDNKEEHWIHVRNMINLLLKANLRLKASKCYFYIKKVEFLEHVIIPGHLAIAKNKVQQILDWLRPTNIRELQLFIRFINYYQKLLQGYVKGMVPLYWLLKKD